MKMKNNFNESPLYRFFNVILFLAYSLVVLFTIIAGFIGYSERDITSATVNCADGTSWNAEEILYDSYALCGICTNRTEVTSEGTRYQECSYKDMDYSSYDTEVTKEVWTWTTVIYPLIVILAGFGLVDAVRLIIIYIFSGRIALEKSVLLRLLAMFASDENASNQQESFEKKYPLLLEIVEKEDVVKAATLWTQVEQGLKQAEEDLSDFFKKQGYDRSFFESDESLDLDVDVLEEFYKLDNNFKDLHLGNLRLSKYFQTIEEVNKHLEKGEDIEEAKKRLQKLQEKDAEEIAEPQVQLELSKAIGEELLAMKKKYGKKFKDKKVNMDDVFARVYEKHPDWKKAKSK